MLVWLSPFAVMPCLHVCKHTVSMFSVQSQLLKSPSVITSFFFTPNRKQTCVSVDSMISFGLNIYIFYGSSLRSPGSKVSVPGRYTLETAVQQCTVGNVGGAVCCQS